MKIEREDEMCEMAGSQNTTSTAGCRKLNFLMVDDDDICLFIHRRVLERSGYCNTAHSARDGKTALEILRLAEEGSAPVPDIILLDLEMPVMNGIAFLEAFRLLNCSHKEHISIVLLTSSVSEKDKAYAMSLGVSRFMSKPLTSEALESVIDALFIRHPASGTPQLKPRARQAP